MVSLEALQDRVAEGMRGVSVQEDNNPTQIKKLCCEQKQKNEAVSRKQSGIKGRFL